MFNDRTVRRPRLRIAGSYHVNSTALAVRFTDWEINLTMSLKTELTALSEYKLIRVVTVPEETLSSLPSRNVAY